MDDKKLTPSEKFEEDMILLNWLWRTLGMQAWELNDLTKNLPEPRGKDDD